MLVSPLTLQPLLDSNALLDLAFDKISPSLPPSGTVVILHGLLFVALISLQRLDLIIPVKWFQEKLGLAVKGVVQEPEQNSLQPCLDAFHKSIAVNLIMHTF